MKKSLLFLILTLFVAMLAIESVDAQPRKKRRKSSRRGKAMPKRSKYFSLGGGVGYNNYFGDLSPTSGLGSSSFNKLNLYVGAVGEYRFHPNFSARAGLAYTMIGASDASADPSTVNSDSYGRYSRNLHFRNNMIEFSTMITANIFPVNRGYLKRAPINPFVFLGINVFTNNPQARAYGKGNTGEWLNLRDLKTEGQGTSDGPESYSGIQAGIPFGVGCKFMLSRKIDISVELGYRFTFSNYLDDVGSSYLDPATYATANPLTVRMSNRSGELKDDFGNVRKLDGKTIDQSSNYVTTVLSDGSSFAYLKGTEKGQAPRGGPSPDYWLTTAVHLHYIIGGSKGGPRRR